MTQIKSNSLKILKANTEKNLEKCERTKKKGKNFPKLKNKYISERGEKTFRPRDAVSCFAVVEKRSELSC